MGMNSRTTEELLKWICERHATNEPLDRQLLRQKALSLATSFGVTGFKCSDAWLTVFLKKHGFSPSLTNCSGPTFPDYRVWVDLLRSLITQYRHKDLFNVDELVMYSDFVPAIIFRKATVHQQHGDQVAKPLEASSSLSKTNRIRMLMCCNSSGTEKLRALISGPYQPVNSRNDCHYHRNEGACLPDDVFAEWLSQLNQDMAESNRKILLLLDRDRIRSSQKVPQLSHVNLLYLPKDFPTQLRPLRGDVFHYVKMVYRSRYVRHIRSSASSERWDADAIIDSIVEAWKGVSQELIVASFQRTKFREDESFLKIECPAWEELGMGISFKKFVTFDDDLSNNSCDSLEELEILAGGTRHQYNLRNSSKGTVDLDDSAIITNDSRRSRKRSSGRMIGDTRQETSNREVQSNDEAQGSSGLTRKRRNVKKAVDSEEDQRHSENSQATDEDISSNEDTRRQVLMDKIQDFLEDDSPLTAKITINAGETSSRRQNNEISKDFTNVAQDQSETMRDPSARIVSDDYKSGFLGENTEGDGGLGSDSIEEVVSNSKRDERGSQSMEHDEPVQNFPGEPGPSGKGLYARAESFGAKNPSSPVGEFGDEEETPDCRQLELKIRDAIECCREIGRSDDDENPGLPGDDNLRTCKRPGEHFDDDEPAEKKARTADGWAKRYETNFVFGPELHGCATGQSDESSSTDVQNHESVSKSKKTQTRGGELEKRCIFTLEGSSSGVSFPATKD